MGEICVERVPIERIKPAKYNPRKDLQPGDPEYERLKRSVERWDLVEPLVWNKRSGNLVGGHQRLKIITERGDIDAPVSVVDLSDQDEAALNVALNKIGGEWDMPKLVDVLSELDANGFDATLTGFDGDELENVLTWTPPGEVTEDEPPPVPDAPQSKLGEVYELGRHRVMCGDSTSQGFQEVISDAVLTDPPYGINQPGVPGDEPEKLNKVAEAVISRLPIVDGVVVVFQSTRTFTVWLDLLRQLGYTFERMLSMYKAAQCTFPWRGWILKSESILIASTGKPQWQEVKPYSHDCYYLSEVSHELGKQEGWHGSVKPMSVVVDLLARITPNAGSVYDPFLGSGTTLIAAEQLNRTCYGMEIEPKYVDVIRQRYANFVKDATFSPTGKLTNG